MGDAHLTKLIRYLLMANDGHILCAKCPRVLYLGKHKNGQFWPGAMTQEQFAQGVTRFIADHFHGDLLVLGDQAYERWLDSRPEHEWPATVFIEVTHDGRVVLVEQAGTGR